MFETIPRLVGIDLETTGSSFNDRIVEIALITFEYGKRLPDYIERINPRIPIPASASYIHGIHDADVVSSPVFPDIADLVLEKISHAVIFGYNIIFDMKILSNELLRCDRIPPNLRNTILLDPFSIWKKLDPKTLKHAYKHFCGKELAGAHNALLDINATYEVLSAQIKQFPDLPNEPKALGLYCYPVDPSWVGSSYHFIWGENGEIICNFAKTKGTPLKRLAEEQKAFCRWILTGDFPGDIKALVQKALNGEPLPVKPIE
ncbi:MAG: 3'-5' exonuclease [Candidatus Aureabacteria bacterium]|nr:3'-5' exonuclease [Candidatus Auribacterota bacterium]